jgi:DNA-directed RNA polymerase specialized sigma24 family protein
MENATFVSQACVGQPETDCQTLLDRIAGGDPQALSDLFRRYSRLVHHVGRRILREPAEADDLVQEVFLYIHRKSALFDSSKGPARSWIIQVAYTQALLRRRELKSHGFYLSGVLDRPVESEQNSNNGARYDSLVLLGKALVHISKEFAK